jgi:sugar transferase (PEP-CTERM/EpsH1 system associated)
MKILWLNINPLLPLDKGGKLRTWHLLRHLARHHEVTYLAFSGRSHSPADLEGMREVCTRLETVPREEPAKGTLRFYTDVLAHSLDPLPYAVGKYRSRAYRRRVGALLETGRFDLIVCDFLFPAVNLPRRLPRPAVLFTHNVEAEIWRRHAATQSQAPMRWFFRSQWRRMLAFERQAMSRFDLVLAVSATDRETLQRVYGADLRAPVRVVATGVDTGYFKPSAAADVDPYRLVFTGAMDWLPNDDAIRYFCREILPRVRASEPRTTLAIVGRAPGAAVRKLADQPGITVTGFVDDVRPYLARGAVYVVPLRIGGGTRLKIFEAMASGQAVVSTSVGAEGLPVTSGRDIVLADDPEAFASSVLRLLRDPSARQRLGHAARTLVEQHYDWSAVAGSLEQALAAAASPRPVVKHPAARLDARIERDSAALRPAADTAP